MDYSFSGIAKELVAKVVRTFGTSLTPKLLASTATLCLCMVLSARATAAKPQSGGASRSPNIVLFLVDDMGVMDTSVPMLTDKDGKPKSYPWNDWYRTPSMERLAARGVRFSNFYSHNVCSPTRVSIMSGQNSARHRCTDYIFPWKNNRLIDTRQYSLYDLKNDPGETKDVSQENPSLAIELKQRLHTWLDALLEVAEEPREKRGRSRTK